MPEFPSLGRHPGTLPVISWFSHGPLLGGALTNGNGSAAWPAANRAYLWMLQLTEPVLLTKLFWFNGATVSGNVDCGIYALDKGALTATRIVSTGSTVQAGVSAPQEVDIADTILGVGEYLIALAATATTTTFLQSGYQSNDREVQQIGVYRADTAFPLPTTLTLAGAAGTIQFVFWCGALTYPRTVL